MTACAVVPGANIAQRRRDVCAAALMVTLPRLDAVSTAETSVSANETGTASSKIPRRAAGRSPIRSIGPGSTGRPATSPADEATTDGVRRRTPFGPRLPPAKAATTVADNY